MGRPSTNQVANVTQNSPSKMNKKSLLGLSLAVLAAASASASRIELATITANDITPGNGLGKDNVEDWLASLVGSYNAANNPDLPAPGDEIVSVNTDDSAPAPYPTFPDDTNSISIPTGDYNYVVFHWGGGAGGGKLQAFYIGGSALSSEVFDTPNRGLSFYRLYGPIANDPIPDSGATLAFLGAGLIGLAAISRRKA